MFTIIDTETSSNGYVVDITLKRVNEYGVGIDTLSFITPYLLNENMWYFNSEYVDLSASQEKTLKLLNLIETGEREYKTIKDINALIKEYILDNNDTLLAYNARFDYLAMLNSNLFVPNTFKCLWSMAANSICKRRDFLDFALYHKAISAKGIVKTNAEVVGNFARNYNTGRLLDNSKGYYMIEEHLSESDIEYFELPILRLLLSEYPDILGSDDIKSYNYRDFIAYNLYQPK